LKLFQEWGEGNEGEWEGDEFKYNIFDTLQELL
jgi:hypothetical protein